MKNKMNDEIVKRGGIRKKIWSKNILSMFVLVVGFCMGCVSAVDYYVDNSLASDCLSGDYSIANRDCSGSDGNAYNTIQKSEDASSTGDTINIRSGTYTESNIKFWFAGPEMTTIQAYNNEAVTIHNPTVYQPTFSLSGLADDITVKDLKFTSQTYLMITGWVDDPLRSNVWMVSYDHLPNLVRFDSLGIAHYLFKASPDNITQEYNVAYDSIAEILYVYSPNDNDPNLYYTNPGVSETNGFAGMAIGATSSSNGYIVVDNCEIDSFAHCGIKGGFKWWIKNCYIHNIGTRSRDHALYLYGSHSIGNEPIIEYNRIEDGAGSGFQLYSGGQDLPGYNIIRYNIVNNWSRSGVQLALSYNKIYSNTISDANVGIMFARSPAHDNEVKNNLFDANSYADIVIDFGGQPLLSYPGENTVENNFYGSAKVSDGASDFSAKVAFTVSDALNFLVGETVTGGISGATATVGSVSGTRIGLIETNANLFEDGETVTSPGGGNAIISRVIFGADSSIWVNTPPNIISLDNQFFSASPTTWSDFRLSDSSLCIDAGANLGSDYDDALDPTDTTWPASTLDQNLYGTGWEIGAFVYLETPQSCTDTGGTCQTNTCDTYTDCASLTGDCATGYCCSGTCTASSTCSSADTDTDGIVDIIELMDYISQWKAGSVTIENLMIGIEEWKNGCA